MRRACSQSGLGPLRRPVIVRPSTQGQAGLWIDQVTGLSKLPAMGAGDQGRSVPSPAAARSRAMPRTERASPRLGVTAISITGSVRPA